MATNDRVWEPPLPKPPPEPWLSFRTSTPAALGAPTYPMRGGGVMLLSMGCGLVLLGLLMWVHWLWMIADPVEIKAQVVHATPDPKDHSINAETERASYQKLQLSFLDKQRPPGSVSLVFELKDDDGALLREPVTQGQVMTLYQVRGAPDTLTYELVTFQRFGLFRWGVGSLLLGFALVFIAALLLFWVRPKLMKPYLQYLWLKEHGEQIMARLVEVRYMWGDNVDEEPYWMLSASWVDPTTKREWIFLSALLPDDSWVRSRLEPLQTALPPDVLLPVLIYPGRPERHWLDVRWINTLTPREH